MSKEGKNKFCGVRRKLQKKQKRNVKKKKK